MAWLVIAVWAALGLTLLLARFVQAIRRTHLRRLSHRESFPLSSTCPARILLGSGGHTGEMIRLLSELPFDRYTPRQYIISSGDTLSKAKALKLESLKGAGEFSFLEIPRARKVHQSFLTTPWTTLISLLYCLWHIAIPNIQLAKPVQGAGLVLLNGPGSAVPIALAAFLPRFLMLRPSPRLVYIESLARVKKLSLSGIILLPLMDVFIVQWGILHAIVTENKGYKFLSRHGLVSQITSEGWMV